MRRRESCFDARKRVFQPAWDRSEDSGGGEDVVKTQQQDGFYFDDTEMGANRAALEKPPAGTMAGSGGRRGSKDGAAWNHQRVVLARTSGT
jgi:hypothetical protein